MHSCKIESDWWSVSTRAMDKEERADAETPAHIIYKAMGFGCRNHPADGSSWTLTRRYLVWRHQHCGSRCTGRVDLYQQRHLSDPCPRVKNFLLYATVGKITSLRNRVKGDARLLWELMSNNGKDRAAVIWEANAKRYQQKENPLWYLQHVKQA